MGPDRAYEDAGELLRAARRLRVVSHLDLDGVAAAALLLRWARRRGARASARVTGARGAYRAVMGELRRSAAEGAVVAVADVSPGGRGAAEALASALRLGAKLVWMDHHVWEPGEAEALRGAGAVVVLDRTRVSAEIVCKVLDCWSDEVSRSIVEAARADDSCSEDLLGLAPRWRLVLRVLGPRDAVRAVEALASGELWPGWAEEVYQSNVGRYYEEIRRATSVSTYSFDGLRILVITPPPRANACDVERALGTPDADLVVVLYPRGLSIRSFPGAPRADCIAKRLGGGGHPAAAGAPRPSMMGPAQVARMVARAAEGCDRLTRGSRGQG